MQNKWTAGRWADVEIGQTVTLRNADGAEVEIGIAMKSDLDYPGNWVRSESCRYDAEDWDLFVKAPPLPTTPGSYLGNDDRPWRLGADGYWHRLNGVRYLPDSAERFAPFIPLEPVPVTAKRVLEAIDETYGEDFIHNPSPEWNKVAAQFGVAQ